MNFDFQEQEQVTDQDESFTGAGGSENQQQQQVEEKKKKNKSIEKPLPTSNNELIIKLRPDPMTVHDNDDVVVSADRSSSMNISKNPASCKHCHKEFGSGKALGAHMRVHPNHNNENRSLSAGMSRFRGIGSKSYLDDLLKDGKPTCSICGKSFVSHKSLFGHMRCHPERHWRGMQPPQHPSDEPATSPCSELISSSGGPHHIGSSAYSSHHDQNYKLVTDLEQCLSCWSVKDKRGRKSSIAKMSRCDNDHDDDEMISSAVHGLMMLQAASNKHHQHHPDEIGDGGSLICKYCTNQSEKLDVVKNGICESGFGGDDHDDPRLVLKSSKSYYDCGDGSDINGSDYNQEEMRKRKVRRTINLKDTECSSNDHDYKMTLPPGAAAASERCYKCATYDKSFVSPQALGGHRSSAHNKIFTRNTSIPQVLVKDAVFENNCGGKGLEEWDRLDEDTSTTREVVHPPPPLQPHVCRTCDKAFPSGQALGGHQRCHWQGPPSSSSSSSPAAAGLQLMNMMCDDQNGSPAAAAGSGTKKAEAFDFDLNEFPANDHEGEGSK